MSIFLKHFLECFSEYELAGPNWDFMSLLVAETTFFYVALYVYTVGQNVYTGQKNLTTSGTLNTGP